jgi:hypothetical protein
MNPDQNDIRKSVNIVRFTYNSTGLYVSGIFEEEGIRKEAASKIETASFMNTVRTKG